MILYDFWGLTFKPNTSYTSFKGDFTVTRAFVR